MNQLIHTSPTLVLHQLGWGIPQAMWPNHAYAFYPDSITNGNGNTKKFSGFGGLEVACWPLVPKFAGSNPAEAVRFLRDK